MPGRPRREDRCAGDAIAGDHLPAPAGDQPFSDANAVRAGLKGYVGDYRKLLPGARAADAADPSATHRGQAHVHPEAEWRLRLRREGNCPAATGGRRTEVGVPSGNHERLQTRLFRDCSLTIRRTAFGSSTNPRNLHRHPSSARQQRISQRGAPNPCTVAHIFTQRICVHSSQTGLTVNSLRLEWVRAAQRRRLAGSVTWHRLYATGTDDACRRPLDDDLETSPPPAGEILRGRAFEWSGAYLSHERRRLPEEVLDVAVPFVIAGRCPGQKGCALRLGAGLRCVIQVLDGRPFGGHAMGSGRTRHSG